MDLVLDHVIYAKAMEIVEWKVHRSENFHQQSDGWISSSLNFPRSKMKTIKGCWTKRPPYRVANPERGSSWSDAESEGV